MTKKPAVPFTPSPEEVTRFLGLHPVEQSAFADYGEDWERDAPMYLERQCPFFIAVVVGNALVEDVLKEFARKVLVDGQKLQDLDRNFVPRLRLTRAALGPVIFSSALFEFCNDLNTARNNVAHKGKFTRSALAAQRLVERDWQLTGIKGRWENRIAGESARVSTESRRRLAEALKPIVAARLGELHKLLCVVSWTMREHPGAFYKWARGQLDVTGSDGNRT